MSNSCRRMALFVLLIVGGAAINTVYAQHLSKTSLKDLEKREDTLKNLAYKIVNAPEPNDRLRADSQFVRTLVRALKVPHSFDYPFDSLSTISSLYAPDSTFRIFTWQYKKDDFLFLQEGAIQMRQPDGSLKLYPLFDVSMFTARPLDSARTRKNWIGAIYYRIIQKSYDGQQYYTLLGFDDFSRDSNKKWLEVLTFSPSGEPIFGGPYLSFQDDSVRKPLGYRFNIEYKKDASTRFNYDAEMDMILYDHLVSESEQPDKKDTYIPDGDFEGFRWKDGRWVHVEKQIFNYKLRDGAFPMDEKMLDESGGMDEQKLMEQSKKNIKKAPAPGKKPVKKPAN